MPALVKYLTIIFGPVKDMKIRRVFVISFITYKRLGTYGVMIISFVEFIDQLIDYPINCDSLSDWVNLE